MITAYTLWVIEPEATRPRDPRSSVREAASRRSSSQAPLGGSDEWRGAQNPPRLSGKIHWLDLWHRFLDDADVEPNLDLRRADVADRRPDPRRAGSRHLGHGPACRVCRRDRADDRHA